MRGLFVILFCACGRSGLLESPPADVLVVGPRDDVSCVPADAGAPPLNHYSSWERGCIDVLYDDLTAAELPFLEEALAAWTSQACTWLCFNAPRQFTSGPGEGHVIMLHGDRGALRAQDPDTVAVFSNTTVMCGTAHCTTRALRTVSIERRRNSRALRQDFVRAVGTALGFEITNGVDSALDGFHAAPTPADLQSVCALYPRC